MNKIRENRLKKLYPECFFNPQYPYNFRLDLILNGVNYGEFEIIVKKGLEISEIKGNKKLLEKLDEVAKKQEGNYFYTSPHMGKYFFKYPITKIDELKHALSKEGWEKNKDYEELIKLIRGCYKPINTELLYEKTGIEIIY